MILLDVWCCWPPHQIVADACIVFIQCAAFVGAQLHTVLVTFQFCPKHLFCFSFLIAELISTIFNFLKADVQSFQ